MDTNLIQKLSTQVVNQLPEFLRVDISDPTSSSDYQTFVAFLQAYYEFLEQNGEAQYIIQNARSYADIDETIDTFVDKFLQEFAYDLPKTIFTDQNPNDYSSIFTDIDQVESKRALAKRIGQIYSTKGSEAAIKLLFRLLFDDEITFYYPKDDMLRASDGRWIERKTIKVYVPGGNVNLLPLEANLITGLTSSATAVVDHISNLGFEISGKDVYELELEKSTIDGTFLGNEIVQFSSGNLTTGNIEVMGNAVVLNVITGFTIIDSGYGYSVGAPINLIGSGNSFNGAVSAVNDGGKIQRFTITNFGASYSSATANVALPTSVKNGRYNLQSNIVTAILVDSTGNSINHGLAANDTINVSFTSNLNGSYNGLYTVRSVPSSKKFKFALANSNTIVGNISLNSRQANISPVVGTLCSYYGYYIGKEGQTDEQIKIQDSYYYQDYSYVIRTTQSSIYWKELVKKILHPAGMELFGEVYIEVTGDAPTGVSARMINVYDAIVTLIKLLSATTSVTIPTAASTISELSIYDQASRNSRYAIGPTYETLEKFKFAYTDLRIYDVGGITLDKLSTSINEPYILPPPNSIKKAGSNIVLNSRFSTDTVWTKETGWSISAGNAVGMATSANLSQLTTVSAVNETIYYCQYEIKSVSTGSIRVNLTANGYSNSSPVRSSVGTYTDYFLLISANILANANLVVSSTTFTGNISNIILKPLETVIG